MVNLIASINSLFWGSLLILLLVGTGIFFTIRLRFVQVRKFRKGITQLTGDFDLNGKDADHNGMSSFQALATAIAAQVGTGNLVRSSNSYSIWRTRSYILDVGKCIFLECQLSMQKQY